MSKAAIQKLIDDEKPAFDYARMFLTSVAWWTLIIIISTNMMDKKGFVFPINIIIYIVLIVGAIFGIYMMIRVSILGENILQEIIGDISKPYSIFRLPIVIILSFVPLFASWLLVWALMFSNITG